MDDQRDVIAAVLRQVHAAAQALDGHTDVHDAFCAFRQVETVVDGSPTS